MINWLIVYPLALLVLARNTLKAISYFRAEETRIEALRRVLREEGK